MSGRILYSTGKPFWFDETFTGVIASQPTLSGLFGWCRAELTGPAFYAPMWLWAKLAGSSDFALRLPSLFLSIVTPLAVLWWGNRDAALRWWWAVFILLWGPVFTVAGEARAYAEIFALGTAQTVLFMRLVAQPTIARASAWIVVFSLVVLCNYWGAIPALVQGVAFLVVHRLRAVRTWPAFLLLAPLFAWAAYHLPFVLAFTQGSSKGIDGLPLSAVLEIPAFLLGIKLNAVLILAVVAGSSLVRLKHERWRPSLPGSPEAIAVLCGLTSIMAILIIAFVRPGFAPRYLTAVIPSFLLGLALWARWMAPRQAKAVILVTALMFATAAGILGGILRDPESDPRHNFELERASAWLGERAPGHLVMLWDNPIGERSDAARLAEVGGFFLRRAGHPVSVDVARAATAVDPNRVVLALTDARRKSAILWFANEAVPNSRRPRIERHDARYECRDFGRGEVNMTACRWRQPSQ
ncbi:hypothetical protein WG901_02305 [Novosphingobium sp. PS1R-30]|uniref:Glycosyltransferase RgtA/B/C/D-like domain-containing protein n=1 Tax=Novosphingobium anseongense TaxID=3133436 RepID=A0ABU8RR37_9SPHN